MSLYGTQKLLFHLNRDAAVQKRYREDLPALLDDYELDAEEREAILAGDIGKLYVLGSNGQLLMHFAALLGMPWADYIEAMREGVRRHGPVPRRHLRDDDLDRRQGRGGLRRRHDRRRALASPPRQSRSRGWRSRSRASSAIGFPRRHRARTRRRSAPRSIRSGRRCATSATSRGRTSRSTTAGPRGSRSACQVLPPNC